MSMREKMRIGLAGLGAASTDIIRALDQSKRVELRAACDIRADTRALFSQRDRALVFSTVADMAQSPEIDAIYVATPNHLHCEHVLIAASCGKDVIVEKPIALTLDERDRMIAAARQNRTR